MSATADQANPAAARLLVVDDDENNRDMISRRLARRGFDVSLASDGSRALEAVGGSAGPVPFDLVLLDIEMPGLSGFDVLRRLREHHPNTRLPVIIATARGDREDVVQALGLGANDYVTKPRDRLRGRVQNIVQKGGYKLDDLAAVVRQAVEAAVVAV